MLTLWLYISHHRQGSRFHRGPEIITLSIRDHLFLLDLIDYECISDHQPCCSKFLYLRLWEEPLHHKSLSPLSLDHVQAAKETGLNMVPETAMTMSNDRQTPSSRLMTTTTAKRKTIMVCWLSWYAPACKAGHQDLVARYADPRYLPRQQNWLLVWRFSTLVTHSPLAPLCLWLLWFASAHFDAIFLAYIFKILTKRRFCFWKKRRCHFFERHQWLSFFQMSFI